MFYPSSGNGETNSLRGSKPYPAGIFNIPIIQENKHSPEYKQLFINKVIPRLHRFKPDLILISAGFDGHELEEMNLDYMKLNENDYRFITEELTKIANKYADGRIVSVLEGGYNINSGIVSSFAQSVMTHVKFLNIGANKFYYDVNNNSQESIENAKINTLEQARLKAKRKREYYLDQLNYKNIKKMKVENKIENGKKENLIKEDQVNENRINNSDYKINEDFRKDINKINNVPQDLIKKKNFNLNLSNESKDKNQDIFSNKYHNNFINNSNMNLDSEHNIYNINFAESGNYNHHHHLNLNNNDNNPNFFDLRTNRKSLLEEENLEGLHYNQTSHNNQDKNIFQTNKYINQDIDQFINMNEDQKNNIEGKSPTIKDKNNKQSDDNNVIDDNNNNNNILDEELLVEFEDE